MYNIRYSGVYCFTWGKGIKYRTGFVGIITLVKQVLYDMSLLIFDLNNKLSDNSFDGHLSLSLSKMTIILFCYLSRAYQLPQAVYFCCT